MMRYLLFILALTLCGTASGDELEDALYRRVVVWETPSGKKVTIAHCGRGEGCKERISAFAGWIESAAAIYQIDQWILGGMAFHESGLNPFAKGSIGERGILQLHPKGVGRNIDFVKNKAFRKACRKEPGACQDAVIMAAAKLLRSGIDKCGSLQKGLGYYNTGRCAATKYSKRVIYQAKQLRALVPGSAAALGLCDYCQSSAESEARKSGLLHCEAPL